MTNINESYTAKGYTPAAKVLGAFGQPRTLDGIVIHHWGLPGQTHQGVVDFFCKTGPGETSAHFVVSAGRIDCIVSPEDAAWHCPGRNTSTIGIECRPEASDADYLTVAELVRFLRETYNRPLPLSKHRDWYATACPGIWDLNRINKLAGSAAIAPQSTTATPPTAPSTEGDQELLIIARDPRSDNPDAVWISNGITRRHIPDPKTLEDYKKLATWGMLKIHANGNVQELPLAVLGVEVK